MDEYSTRMVTSPSISLSAVHSWMPTLVPSPSLSTTSARNVSIRPILRRRIVAPCGRTNLRSKQSMAAPAAQEPRTKFAYDEWMDSRGVPVHRGFFVRDVRNMELGWWEERKCNTAFIQLAGQEGVSEARVTEIKPGEMLPPYKMAIDEVVYVVSGRGVANVWSDAAPSPRIFEWQDHVLFLIPHNLYRQFGNMQGDKPVRLLHYSYLPLAMSVVPDPDFFLNNPYKPPASEARQDFYSEAKVISGGSGLRWQDSGGDRAYWYGNFFPDMRAWDKLNVNTHRG